MTIASNLTELQEMWLRELEYQFDKREALAILPFTAKEAQIHFTTHRKLAEAVMLSTERCRAIDSLIQNLAKQNLK